MPGRRQRRQPDAYEKLTARGRRDAEEEKRNHVPAGLAVAQFLRAYPGTYRGGWPTQDGVVPWRLFWMLHQAIPAVFALERLNQTQAIAHALGMALAGKDGRVAELTRKTMEEAGLTGVSR